MRSHTGREDLCAAPSSISVALAPGTLARFNVVLRDPSGTCGYAYSLGTTAPWATFAPDLQSGTVGETPATAPPATATDTGSGNGFTPVTISAAGMRAGRTYRSQLTVQSQNAAGNPGTVPITVHVLGPHPAKPRRKRKRH